MKQIIVLVGVIVLSTGAFALPGFSKHSTSLNSLGDAWKNQQYVHPKQDKNDIAMVYGGADISRRPTIVYHTTTT